MSEPLIVTSFESLRVLVIDDDRAILEVVEAMLKIAGIGSVVKTVSALGALNILADKQKRFNCVVCDYGMDGLTLLRDIRAGKHTYIPRDQCFIMLTAHGQEAVVRAAIELDVNGYVRKPVTKDSLTKAIHRAFNRTPALKAPEFYAATAVPAQG